MAPPPPIVCGADSFTAFWDAGKTRSQAEVACRDHYRTLHGDPTLDRGFLAFPKTAIEQQQMWVLASLETWPSGWIAGGASDYGTNGAKAGWAWGDYMDAADTFHGLRGPNSQANRQFFTHIATAGWNSANAAESHHCMVLTNNGGAWESEDCESTSVKGYICMLECEWPPTQNVVATDVCLSALSEECDNGHISNFCGCPSEAAVIIAQNNDPYYTAPPPPPPAFPPGMAPSPPLVCGADSFTSFWDAGKTRKQAEVACRDHYRTLHGDPSLDRGFLAFPKDAAEQQQLWVLASLETWPSGWIAGGASDYGTNGAKAGWAWGDYMDAADTFHGLRGPNSQANRQFFTHIATAGWNSANAAESHHCMVLTNNGGAWQSEDCESTSVKGYICMLECEWPPTQNVVATDVCLSALGAECDNGHISDFCGCPSEAAVIIAQNNDPYYTAPPPPPPAFPPGMAPSPPLVCGADSFTAFWDAGKTRSQAEVACRDHYRTLYNQPSLDRGFLAFPKDAAEQQYLWVLASLETWPSGWIAGGAADYGTKGAKAGWAWGDYMDAADTFHGLRGPNSQANRQFFTHIAAAGWNSANAAESHHCMVLTNNGGAWQSEDCESTSVKGYICMLECEWPPTQNVVATDVCLSALGAECDNGHISDFCGCPSEAAVIIAQNNDPYYTAPPPPPPAFPPGMAPSPPLVCGADSFTSFWDAGKTRKQAEVACRDHYRTLHGDPSLDRGFLAFPKDAAEQQYLWTLASLETWPSGWIAGGAADYGTKGAKAGWAWGDYMDAADTFHGLRGPNSQANRQFFTHIAAAGWNSANAAESHHCMVLTNNGGAWQSEDCESTSVKGYICMLECEWPPTQNVVATDVCLSALSEECDNGHISDFCGCPSEAAVIIAQNNDPYYTAPPPPPPAFPPGMAPAPPMVCGADSFTSFWDAGKTRSQAEVACRDHYRTLHGDPSLDRGFLAFPKDAAEQQQLWVLASLETWPSGWIAGGASDYGFKGAKAGWAWGDYMDAADTFHGLRGPNSQANRQFFTHIAAAGWNSANAAESHHCMVLTHNGGAWQSEDCESTNVKGYICMLECEWPPTQNVVATDVCLSALSEECDNGHISDFCGCPSEAAVIIAQNNDPYFNPSYANGRRLYGKDGYGYGDETEHYDEADEELAREWP